LDRLCQETDGSSARYLTGNALPPRDPNDDDEDDEDEEDEDEEPAVVREPDDDE